tara:strand:+ start:14332 stop:14739 length:408 start_codon:yes stop_codon:yes gene_type:complete
MKKKVIQKKIKTRYAPELGIYILKEKEKNYSDKYNPTYNGSGNFSKYYGYKDITDIKISMIEVLDFINLLFSKKYNYFSQREEFRKELKITKDKFLEISVNLKVHVKKHNLTFYMDYLRKKTNNKNISLTMKESK